MCLLPRRGVEVVNLSLVEAEGVVEVRRIAIVGNWGDTLVRFRGPLIEALIAAGAEVHAFAPEYTPDERAAVIRMGAIPVDYSLDRAGLNPFKDAKVVRALSREFRKRRVDTVFSYFAKPIIYGSIAARLANVKSVFAMIEGAGHVFSENQPRNLKRAMLRFMVAWLYRIALIKVTRVFVLNEDDRRLFADSRMVASHKVVCLDGIGIDLEDYSVTPTASCKEASVVFLMATRLLKEKGVAEYAEAASALKLRHPQARFVLLGGVDPNPDAFREEEIRKMVDERLLEWPGRVLDVRPWLKEASVFVLPSYYREGVPRSILEAMASGKPIITTDWVGCRETVIDGVNGFLVPVKNASALAAVMLRFIEEPSLIPRMGAESRRIAETRFDVREINTRILRAMDIASA